MSIEDDRIVVGQTYFDSTSSGLGDFFLTSEYTVLCEGSSALNRKNIYTHGQYKL